MTRNSIILYTFFLLLCTACQKQPSQGSATVLSPGNLPEITLEEFTHTIAHTRIVPLETSDSCLMGNVRKVCRHEGKYYLQALGESGGDELFVFDGRGCFLYKIGSRGAAGHEYVRFKNFFIHQKGIYIVDDMSMKLLHYRLDGSFVTKYKLPHSLKFARDFISLDSTRVLCVNGITFPKYRQLYQILEINKDIQLTTISETPYHFNGESFFAGKEIARSNHAVWMLFPLDKSVYMLDLATSRPVKALTIEFGGYAPPPEERDYQQAKALWKQNDIKPLWALYCVRNKLFINLKQGFIYWDAELQKGTFVNAGVNPRNFSSYPFYALHVKWSDDEGLVAPIRAEEFVETASIQGLNIQDVDGRFITEESNPVLVLYDL